MTLGHLLVLNIKMLKENSFTTLLIFYAFFPMQAISKDLYFDPALVSGNGELSETMVLDTTKNKSVFDVLVNGKYIDTLTLDNKSNNPERYNICFTAKNLDLLGLTGNLKLSSDKCYFIEDVYDGSSAEIDYQNLTINLLIPQAYMKDIQVSNDFNSWDDGENALMASYTYSGSSRESNSSRNTSDYFNLTSGANLGAWRYRNEGYYSRNSNKYSSESTWKTISNYISRPVKAIKGEVTIGDATTRSSVFDSFSFRGANISSDERMLPDRLSGYAPVVKGNANSASHIVIKQRDVIIYDVYVPPGPYAIDDLRPMYTNGDLEVIVTDANGAITRYIEPYSTIPVMKRPGMLTYNVSVGEFASSDKKSDNPLFIQAEFLYGFEKFTGFAGVTYSENYNSQLLGAGFNVSNIGAISLDVTNSNAFITRNMTWENGQSLRGLYSHTLNEIGTTIQLAGYKYSSSGFYTFQESVYSNKSQHVDYANLYNNGFQSGRSKEQLQLSLSQSLLSNINVYLSGSKKNYWDSNRIEKSIVSGVSGNVNVVNYNLSYRFSNMNYKEKPDKAISFSLWFPLNFSGNGNNSSPLWLHLNSANTNSNGSSTQIGLSGRALQDERLDWNVTGDKSNGSNVGSSVSANYTGNIGKYTAGYSHNQSGNQLNYGVSGGMIATSDGLSLGQKLGETNIVVQANGAKDVAIENHTGIKTNSWGNAIITNANVYRRNKVALKVDELDDDVEISDPIKTVVPTRKSITVTKFNVSVGGKGLIKLIFNGNILPLGTVVSNDNYTGIVDDQGVVYLTGLKENGVITAKWGEGKGKQCTASYNFNLEALDSHIVKNELICRE